MKKEDPRTKNLPVDKQFGQPGGNEPWRKGRPKGAKNKETIWFEAMKEIAETFRLEEGVDQVQREIVKTGFKQAFGGNYQFWNKMITELKLAEDDRLNIKVDGEIEQKIIDDKGLLKASEVYAEHLKGTIREEASSGKHSGVDKKRGDSKRKGKAD